MPNVGSPLAHDREAGLAIFEAFIAKHEGEVKGEAALAHNFIPVIVRGEPLAKYHQKPIAANKPTALTQQKYDAPAWLK